MVQVVVIEPHLLLRLGLASLMACLTSSERIKSQSYDDLYQSPPHASTTDLVLLGAHPDERIHLLIQAARRVHAPKRLILLSEPASPPASWNNLPAAVTGYLSTTSSAEAILSAIHPLIHHKYPVRGSSSTTLKEGPGTISPGQVYASHYPPPFQPSLPAFKFEVDEAKMLGLSARQYEVLLLLAQGHPIKVICRHLNISMATTKGHLEAIYQRLGVHNRNEAVFVALAHGAHLKMPDPNQRRQ